MMRNNFNKFMYDPDFYELKISNLLIGIEDTFYDRAMLNKMRFGREYLSRIPLLNYYNESETINYLRQTIQAYNLTKRNRFVEFSHQMY